MRRRATMSLRIRRARPSDFPAAMKVIEPDRALFPSTLWRALPALLVELLESDRVLLCVIEETEPPDVRFLGANTFLNPAMRDEILEHPTETVAAATLMLQRERGTALLNRRDVAAANRRGDLCLLNLFGTIEHLTAGGASVNDAVAKATTAWTFFHSGFRFREILVETSDARQVEIFKQLAARFLRERRGASGRPTWLFRRRTSLNPRIYIR
jgi:hypothetical protein